VISFLKRDITYVYQKNHGPVVFLSRSEVVYDDIEHVVYIPIIQGP
jgi:hypothetical protein